MATEAGGIPVKNCRRPAADGSGEHCTARTKTQPHGISWHKNDYVSPLQHLRRTPAVTEPSSIPLETGHWPTQDPDVSDANHVP
jgi:hypothetical protein